MKVQLGDRLRMRPTIDTTLGNREEYFLPCTVVYINERHHWFQVEFETEHGYKFRESFPLEVDV